MFKRYHVEYILHMTMTDTSLRF